MWTPHGEGAEHNSSDYKHNKVNAVRSDNPRNEMWVFKATWDNQQKSSEPKLQVHHSDLIKGEDDESLT